MARGRGSGSKFWLLSVVGACAVIALLIMNAPTHTSSVAVQGPAPVTATTAKPRAKTPAKPAATTPTTRVASVPATVQSTTPHSATQATLPDVPARRKRLRATTPATVPVTTLATTPATVPTMIVGHLPATE
jgi:hypothetical protein